MTKPKDKTQKLKRNIEKLIERLNKLDERLDILNTLSKSMPIITICTGALVGSIVYLMSVSFRPVHQKMILPETGEEVSYIITKNVKIIAPIDDSAILLPEKLQAKVEDIDFDKKIVEIEFVAQTQQGDIMKIGKAKRLNKEDSVIYEYTWEEELSSGLYNIWTNVYLNNGNVVQSELIKIDIEN